MKKNISQATIKVIDTKPIFRIEEIGKLYQEQIKYYICSMLETSDLGFLATAK